jgi:thioredoxin-like negative regulator of GroEL
VARLQEIEAVLQTLKEDYWLTEVQLQELAAQGWIAAADKQDLSEKSTVSPGRLLPAREVLGDMLLQDGRPADALREYVALLRRDALRFRSYFGAREAAAAAGNAEEARH